MKPLVRWTIGRVQPSGYDSLLRSILSFRRIYDVDIAICINGYSNFCYDDQGMFTIVNQSKFTGGRGVAWKLYPPRLDALRHEIWIDNDLIIEKPIREIDLFLESDKHTLLLEGTGRHYGRFERHVPQPYKINSGIFGVPPNFQLQKFVNFFGEEWENNAINRPMSYTFDEQGLVATALLSAPHLIIPATSITNCEKVFRPAAGMHFIGLNRTLRHQPWIEYKHCKIPLY